MGGSHIAFGPSTLEKLEHKVVRCMEEADTQREKAECFFSFFWLFPVASSLECLGA